MLTTQNERKAMMARHGLYVKEKCNYCGRLIQQTFVYRPIGVTDTVGPPAAGPELDRVVYCSRECQERAYYGNEKYERMHAKRQGENEPEQRCVECGGSVPKFKKAGAKFCSKHCWQKHHRRENPKVAEIRPATR